MSDEYSVGSNNNNNKVSRVQLARNARGRLAIKTTQQQRNTAQPVAVQFGSRAEQKATTQPGRIRIK